MGVGGVPNPAELSNREDVARSWGVGGGGGGWGEVVGVGALLASGVLKLWLNFLSKALLLRSAKRGPKVGEHLQRRTTSQEAVHKFKFVSLPLYP